MTEVASAFVSLMPSARGFGSKLDSQISGDINSSGKKAGAGFGKVFAVAGGALAAAGIGSFLKDAVGGAGQLEQSIGAIDTIFGRSADKMHSWSEGAAQSVGLTKNEFNELGTLIGSQLKNGGTAMDQLAPKTKELITAGADLSAMFGGSTKDAVAALSSALKGERDPIERYGVSLNQAKIDAEAAALGFEKVDGALSGQAQQAATLSLIMKQTSDAQGTFAKESSTLAGQQQRLSASWGNMKTQLGTVLLPVINSVVSALNGTFLPALSKIGPVFSAVVAYLSPFVTQIKSAFGGGSGGGILASVQTFVTTLRAQLLPVFSQVAAIITGKVLPVVTSMAQFFYGRLIPAVAQVVQAVGAKLKPIFDQLVVTFRGKVLPAVSDLLTKFREWQPTIQKVTLVVVKIIGKVLEFAAAVLGKVLPPVIKFAGFLIGNLVPAIGGAVSILGQIIAAFVDTGRQIVSAGQAFGKFANTVDSKIRAALGFVAAVPGKILAIFANAGTLLLGAGGRLMDGLRQGIENKIEDAVQAVRDGLSRIKDLLPGSPIKNGPLKGWNGGTPGKLLMEMLARGLKIGSKSVQAEMTNVVEALGKKLDSLKSKLSSLTSDFSSLAGSVASAFNPDVFGLGGKDAVTEEIDGIVTVLSPATTALQEFMGGLTGNNSNLTAMLAAFDQLKAAGASTGFLSSLFQSGNTQLATQLATAGPAAVQQASALFDQNASLAATLGGKVATNELGPKMESVRVEIAELRKDMKALLPLIAKDVEKGAEKGTRAGNDDRSKDAKQRERAGR